MTIENFMKLVGSNKRAMTATRNSVTDCTLLTSKQSLTDFHLEEGVWSRKTQERTCPLLSCASHVLNSCGAALLGNRWKLALKFLCSYMGMADMLEVCDPSSNPNEVIWKIRKTIRVSLEFATRLFVEKLIPDFNLEKMEKVPTSATDLVVCHRACHPSLYVCHYFMYCLHLVKTFWVTREESPRKHRFSAAHGPVRADLALWANAFIGELFLLARSIVQPALLVALTTEVATFAMSADVYSVDSVHIVLFILGIIVFAHIHFAPVGFHPLLHILFCILKNVVYILTISLFKFCEQDQRYCRLASIVPVLYLHFSFLYIFSLLWFGVTIFVSYGIPIVCQILREHRHRAENVNFDVNFQTQGKGKARKSGKAGFHNCANVNFALREQQQLEADANGEPIHIKSHKRKDRSRNRTNVVDNSVLVNLDKRSNEVVIDRVGPVFDSETYKGMSLPKFMLKLDYENVEGILGSFRKYNPTFSNPDDSKTFVELKRNFQLVRETWRTNENTEPLKDFLIMLFSSHFKQVETETRNYEGPEHIKFDKDADVFMSDFQVKHFLPTTTRRKKVMVEVPSLMTRTNCYGPIYDVVMQCKKKCCQLSIQKVRSILKNFVSQNKTDDEIEEYFETRTYLWRDREKVPDYDKLAWCWTYILPSMYYVDGDRDEIYQIFKSHIVALRERLLTFVKNYIKVSKLSRRERAELRQCRIKKFAEIMRSPAYQAEFTAGETKAAICDRIYYEHKRELNDATFNSQAYTSNVQSKRRTAQYTRLRAVYEKEANNTDFLYDVNFDAHSGRPHFSFETNYLRWLLAIPVVGAVVYWFINLYRHVRRVIDTYTGYANQATQVVGQVELQVRNIMRMGQVGEEIMCPETKLIILDIKSVLHAIKYALEGKYTEAFWWVSNLCISRVENIRDFFLNMDLNPFRERAQANPTFYYEGRQYMCARDDFRATMQAIRNGQAQGRIDNGFMWLAEEHFNAESLSQYNSLISGFARLFANSRVVNLTEADIRLANSQFTYINHVGKSIESMTATMSTILSVVSRTLFGYDPLDANYQQFSFKALTIIEFVDKLQLKQAAELNVVEFMQEIVDKYDEASELNRAVDFQMLPVFLQRAFCDRLAKLTPYAEEAKNGLITSYDRIEPLFLFMTGPPGVGKSALTKFVERAWCYKEGTTYTANMTYAYNPLSGYWEGYKNQPFVVMDDMFKFDDMDSRRNESGTGIDCINTSKTTLNMAFAGKGKVNFDSKLIIGSTNLANEGFDKARWNIGLTDPSAFLRRCHLVIHRTEKLTTDVTLATWQISKCQFKPEAEGTVMTGKQVFELLWECRVRQVAAGKQFYYTNEKLAEVFARQDAPLVPNGVPPVEQPNLQDQPKDAEVARDEGFMAESDQGIAISPESFMALYARTIMNEVWTQNNVKYVTIFFSVLTAMSLGYMAYNFWMSMSGESRGSLRGSEMDGAEKFDNNPLVRPGQRVRTRDGKPHREARWKKVVAKHFKSESLESDYELGIINTLLPCSCAIEVYGYRNDTLIVSDTCCTFHVKDRMMVTSAHCLKKFSGLSIEVRITLKGKEYNFEIEHVMENSDSEDIIFYRLPNTVPEPRAIYKYLIDAEMEVDFHIPQGDVLKLLVCNAGGVPYARTVYKAHKSGRLQYVNGQHNFIIRQPIYYHSRTEPGNSAGLIVAQGSQGKYHIIGMHCGSSLGYAAGLSFNKQYMDNALKEFHSNEDASVGSEDDFMTESSQPFPHIVDLEVPMEEASMMPQKTRLESSPLHGWYGPPVCIPARFKPFKDANGVEICPLDKALRKMHQTATHNVTVSKQAMDYFKRLYPRGGGTILDWQSSLSGDPFREIPGINYGSSPGYPYCLSKTKGKAPYILNDGESYFYGEGVLEDLMAKEKKLLSGENIKVYWNDMLKDETRPIEKVQAGKTRLFSACPLDYLIIGRRYFLDMQIFIQKQAASKPISVGINPHSLEWAVLHGRLNQSARSVVAGDFSNWDGVLPAGLCDAFIDYVNWWYDDGEENARVRKLLGRHIGHAQHICGQKVYTVVDGNPSGNPFTSIYNSFANIIMMYTVLVEDLGLSEDKFELAAYGDDNIMAIDEPGYTVDHFSQHFMRRYGMTYTHFSKDATASGRVDSLDSISYLGRKFSWTAGHLRAPLEVSTIVESTYWMRSAIPFVTFLLAVTESFCIECAHLPETEFDRLTNQFLSIVKERCPDSYGDVQLRIRTYYFYTQRMYAPNTGLRYLQ